MTETFKIALAGLGTVGAEVLRLITQNSELFAARCGRTFEITAVSARDRSRDRGVSLDGFAWFDDPVEMAREAKADMIVELIGGSDGVAKALSETALNNGRHVVTANKALLAEHGTALAKLADGAGLGLAYEAAIAGGIPVVKAIREGLAANRIERVFGILNGTCNYILTDMRESGRSFDEVLKEAMALGYAEADPSFDVDGIDAAHKLALLTSLAFGTEVDFSNVAIEGIRDITPLDISFAEELGYRIKLLGVTSRVPEDEGGGVEQRVQPYMVPRQSPLGQVDGVYNAVLVQGDAADDTTYQGRGAGAGPTASAVIADILDVIRGNRPPTFGIPAAALAPAKSANSENRTGAYYVRLKVKDQPGVIADISAALRDEEVSLESVIQRGRAPDDAVPVVLTTHDTSESGMRRAVDQIAKLEAVLVQPCIIKIESF